MSIKSKLVAAGNAALRPLGAEITKLDSELKPWDEDFIRWVQEAEQKGVDPNDLGDDDWGMQVLSQALDSYYAPLLSEDKIVLELGPGTGRLTRHLLGKVKSLVLVDYSKYVIDFIDKYLDNKIEHSVHLIDSPVMPNVASNSVDLCFANGVFEHIDPDNTCWLIGEFGRVLKPGGVALFNFNNILTEQWAEFYRTHRGLPGETCLFRFYHPEVIQKYGELGGLVLDGIHLTNHRLSFAQLRKPA